VTATGTVQAYEDINFVYPHARFRSRCSNESAVVTESVAMVEHSLNVNALGATPPMQSSHSRRSCC